MNPSIGKPSARKDCSSTSLSGELVFDYPAKSRGDHEYMGRTYSMWRFFNVVGELWFAKLVLTMLLMLRDLADVV